MIPLERLQELRALADDLHARGFDLGSALRDGAAEEMLTEIEHLRQALGDYVRGHITLLYGWHVGENKMGYYPSFPPPNYREGHFNPDPIAAILELYESPPTPQGEKHEV